MKANELMIGDWVYSASMTPRKVQYLDGAKSDSIGVADHLNFESRINPIPLTPKILENNGFVYDGHIIGSDGYDCRSYNLNDSQVWGYLTKDGFEIAFGGHNQPDGIIIKYVHQLQHALRLCGLDELADNFNIY